MSWYLFQDAAAYQNRGKKVDGFNCNPFVIQMFPKEKSISPGV